MWMRITSLFDFYITPEDVEETYLHRRWMGPEYRNIPMFFKVRPSIKFTQRVPRGIGMNTAFGGYVRHYGKAISVKRWEDACEYYVDVRWADRKPKLRQSWEDRKGKAIHTESDFDRPLITWDERFDTSKIMEI